MDEPVPVRVVDEEEHARDLEDLRKNEKQSEIFDMIVEAIDSQVSAKLPIQNEKAIREIVSGTGNILLRLIYLFHF